MQAAGNAIAADLGLCQRLRKDAATAPALTAFLVQIAVNLLLMAGSLSWLVLGPADATQLVNAVLLGMVFVQVGFVAHDADHGQVFARRAANRLCAWLHWNLLTGLSAAWWRDKHARHHRHVNDPRHDADFYPLLSYTTEQATARRGLGRLVARHQAIVFPLLLCSTRAYFQWLSLEFVVARRGLWARELGALVVHHSVFLALLFGSLPTGLALGFLALNYATTGFYMGLVFSTNHLGMPLRAGDGRGADLPAQIRATRNVATGRLGDLLWGGLNYQIQHHLAPELPRFRLRAASRVLRGQCAARGIACHVVTPTVAWREALAWLHAVGGPLRARGGGAC